jgi:cation diffusion facilitator family transporter
LSSQRLPFVEGTKEWKYQESILRDGIKSDEFINGIKAAKVKEFYTQQNSYIKYLLGEEERGVTFDTSLTRLVVYLSVALNVALFMLKIFAAVWSGSIAVVASALDSFLDLFSGLIMYYSDRARRNVDRTRYPIGRETMENIGVLLFAMIMSMSMVTILINSVQELLQTTHESVTFDTVTIVVLSCTIGSKFIMCIFATYVNRIQPNISVEAYAQDHFNDVLTNTVGTIGVAVAGSFPDLWWFDPTAAICLAVYIIANWAFTVRLSSLFSSIFKTHYNYCVILIILCFRLPWQEMNYSHDHHSSLPTPSVS